MTETLHADRVRVRLPADGVAEVTLLRADKMNALDGAMFTGLLGALAQLQQQPNLRAVVLHGEGRAFCAGLDKDSFAAMADGRNHSGPLADLLTRSHGAANAPQQVAWGWRQLPVPVVAAVQGAAFGGGLQLALGADLRFVRPDAQLSVLEMQWGLVPDMAGCVLLTELLRPDVVRDLVFSARVVLGTEAQALGLATRVCDDPLAEARVWAAQVATRSPEAVRAAKRLLNGASPVAANAVLLAESLEQQHLIGSPNQVEAVRAGLEKRAPRFT